MPKRIFANFRLKLWALVIALGIWFYADSQTATSQRTSAVLSVTPPADHAIVYQSHRTAAFTLTGPDASMQSWQERGPTQVLTRVLGVEDLSLGWAELPLDSEWLRGPRMPDEFVRLKLRSPDPQAVTVFVSPVRKRTLQVRLHRSFQLSAGLRYVNPPSFDPPSVTVEGPAAAVDALEAIETMPLPVPEAGTRVRHTVALQGRVPVTLPGGTTVDVDLTLEPANVEVGIHVSGEVEREQEFTDVPVWVQALPGFPYDAELAEDGATVTVTVKAAPAVLRRLATQDVRAYIDVQSRAAEPIEAGQERPFREKVRVQLPPELTYRAVTVAPPEVTVVLKNPAGPVE